MLAGFDERTHDGASLREWEHHKVMVFVDENVERVVNKARLCGAEVLQKVEIGAPSGPRATNSPSITVPAGKLSSAAAIEGSL
jgi:hypothetical protein